MVAREARETRPIAESPMRAKVLDKCFVKLVDWMGDDRRIVQAARVSTNTESKDTQADRELIRYLIRHDHGTPLEKVVFEFHVKAPIFVARQWFRHRIGSFNERSGRYTQFEEEFFLPDPQDINPRAKGKKQGRAEGEHYGEWVAQDLVNEMQDASNQAFSSYEYMLEKDVAPEIARIVLPVSTYTEWFWTVNLRSLMNFLKLRSAPNAQKEIRAYAEAIWPMAHMVCPLAMEAFEDYTINGVSFSAQEWALVRQMVEDSGWVGQLEYNEDYNPHMSRGEWDEFMEKLRRP